MSETIKSILIKAGIVMSIYSFLVIIGNFLNDFFLVEYFTQFFVLLRTTIRPLMFIWDFHTSFLLVGLSISMFLAYVMFKALLVIKGVLEKPE